MSAPTAPVPAPAAGEPRKLYRDPAKAMIGGVCIGLAEYLGLDATVVRVGFALLAVVTFLAAVFAYLVMWALIPIKPAVPTVPPAAPPPVQQS